MPLLQVSMLIMFMFPDCSLCRSRDCSAPSLCVCQNPAWSQPSNNVIILYNLYTPPSPLHPIGLFPHKTIHTPIPSLHTQSADFQKDYVVCICVDQQFVYSRAVTALRRTYISNYLFTTFTFTFSSSLETRYHKLRLGLQHSHQTLVGPAPCTTFSSVQWLTRRSQGFLDPPEKDQNSLRGARFTHRAPHPTLTSPRSYAEVRFHPSYDDAKWISACISSEAGLEC